MKKILISLGVLVVLVLIGFAAYNFLPSSKSLTDQFNEIDLLNKQLISMPPLSNMLADLPAKESAKDFVGAVNLINTALAQINQSVQQANQIKEKISQIANNDISGAQKAKFDIIVGMLSDRNDAFLRIEDNQKQILELAKNYYQSIVNNQKATAPTPSQILVLSQKIQADSKIFSQLNASIASSTAEFLSR